MAAATKEVGVVLVRVLVLVHVKGKDWEFSSSPTLTPLYAIAAASSGFPPQID